MDHAFETLRREAVSLIHNAAAAFRENAAFREKAAGPAPEDSSAAIISDRLAMAADCLQAMSLISDYLNPEPATEL